MEDNGLKSTRGSCLGETLLNRTKISYSPSPLLFKVQQVTVAGLLLKDS